MIKFKKEATKMNSMTPLISATPLKMLITDTRVGRNTKSLVSSVSERALRHPHTMSFIFNAINSISDDLALLVESPAADEAGTLVKEEKLMELMQINQGLLQSIGVSHESIETVVRMTRKAKLVSKLTGAGGGGCVLTFVPTCILLLYGLFSFCAFSWSGISDSRPGLNKYATTRTIKPLIPNSLNKQEYKYLKKK
jgi:mevalonate kinase